MRRPLLFVLCSLVACAPAGSPNDTGDVLSSEEGTLKRVPALGTDTTFDVGSWNVSWFGSTVPGFGPDDETKQLANVGRVLRGLQLDLWGLVEVVSEAQFTALVQKMPGYSGLLATDPSVTDGKAFYTASEQKPALLFRTDAIHVVSARLILTESQAVFGGRPPLEASLEVDVNGKTRTLVVVVLHLKAKTDADSYADRKAASDALKAYLDATYVNRWVLVVGDWNDDIDTSTRKGNPSPFQAFVDDGARYHFTTAALSESGTATTTDFPNTIDHHLSTRSLLPRFVDGSADVFEAEPYVADYAASTSDHYPVLTRYDLR